MDNQELLNELAGMLKLTTHPGKGWFTVKQIAEARGVTYQKISNTLHKEVKNGTVETCVVGKTRYFKKVQGD